MVKRYRAACPRIRTLPPPLSKLTGVSERFVVTGGNRLAGEVAVGGAKNSVLKRMAATGHAPGGAATARRPLQHRARLRCRGGRSPARRGDSARVSVGGRDRE